MTGSVGSPTVSVVIPAFNAADFVTDTLASVLGQTRRADQIVVVDDGSEDDTARIAETFAGVTVLRRPHRGAPAARNVGIAASTGTLLAFCDADDWWEPPKLERQLALIEAEPWRDAVFTHVAEFVDRRASGATTAMRGPVPQTAAPLVSSLILRRDVVDRVGPFDEDSPTGDWVDWYIRLIGSDANVATVGEVLVHRRLHGRNNSLQRANRDARLVAAVRAHLISRQGRG